MQSRTKESDLKYTKGQVTQRMVVWILMSRKRRKNQVLEQYLYRSRDPSPSVIDTRGRFDGGKLAIYSYCIENPHIILDRSEADVGFLTRKLLEKEFFILFTNCWTSYINAKWRVLLLLNCCLCMYRTRSMEPARNDPIYYFLGPRRQKAVFQMLHCQQSQPYIQTAKRNPKCFLLKRRDNKRNK